MSQKSKRKKVVVGLLGIGLDNEDGHVRLTRGENFVVVGGSQATHEAMQKHALHINTSLEKQGKCLQDASIEEIIDLLCRDQ